jgi:hypothetical protein
MKSILFFTMFLIYILFGCNNPVNKTNPKKKDSIIEDTIIRLEKKYKTTYKANFTSEAGRFKARFSDFTKPTQKTDKVTNEYGTMEIFSFVYELPGISIFTVMYNDYPEAVLKKFSPLQIMNNVDSSFIDRIKLQQVTKYPFATLQDNPTTRLNGQTQNFYLFKQNMMVKNRLYQLFLIRFDHYPEPNDFEEFIYTFDIIN